jgi:hypothetical protein
MITLLTSEEWHEVTPPFCFMKVKNDRWTPVHREMIKKWLEAHCGAGWVYYDGSETYVFGSEGDRLMFKMWIKCDPFENDDDGQLV